MKSAIVLSMLASFPSMGEAGNSDREKAALARIAQTELSRLGCYRMKVDGSWGSASRRALATYYAAKSTKSDALEPTVQLIGRLGNERRAVCAVKHEILAASAHKAGKPKVDITRVAKRRLVKTEISDEVRVRLLKSLLNPGSF